MLMDLSRVKEAYPQLLSLLVCKGYAASTIEKYRWVINRFLSEANSPDICSFEDYFVYLGERLSPASMPEIKTYLGTLKFYAETGVFYRETGCRTGFMRQSSYNQLTPYFKDLVDNSLQELSGSYEEGIIKSVKSAGSVFCLYFQRHGHRTFSSVDRQQTVLEYFHDGKSHLRNNAHRYQVALFLSANADRDPSCGTVLSFFPLVPD